MRHKTVLLLTWLSLFFYFVLLLVLRAPVHKYCALKVSRKSFPNHRRQNRGGLDNVLVELIVGAECKGKYNILSTLSICQLCQIVIG